MNNDRKQQRKALLAQVKQNAKAKEEAELPLTKDNLARLFTYVNEMLDVEGCDHTLRYTTAYLKEQSLPADKTIVWLGE